MRILPGARGFTAEFGGQTIPVWDPVYSEGDYEFDVAKFHSKHLGEKIETDDIVWASRMLQDQCIFLAPGLQNYMVSSPMIRSTGGLILQVYADEATYAPPQMRGVIDQQTRSRPLSLSRGIPPLHRSSRKGKNPVSTTEPQEISKASFLGSRDPEQTAGSMKSMTFWEPSGKWRPERIPANASPRQSSSHSPPAFDSDEFVYSSSI